MWDGYFAARSSTLLAKRMPTLGITYIKHWLVGQHRVMGQGEINYADITYRRRLMVMKSLDDLVGKLCDTLTAAGRMDSAYVFFTSDNGFHMGPVEIPPSNRESAREHPISVLSGQQPATFLFMLTAALLMTSSHSEGSSPCPMINGFRTSLTSVSRC